MYGVAATVADADRIRLEVVSGGVAALPTCRNVVDPTCCEVALAPGSGERCTAAPCRAGPLSDVKSPYTT